jgi:predicted N-formylglutamate amidohydrolase
VLGQLPFGPRQAFESCADLLFDRGQSGNQTSLLPIRFKDTGVFCNDCNRIFRKENILTLTARYPDHEAMNQGDSELMPAQPENVFPVVRLENPTAPGPCLIVCEHASNHIPAEFSGLGLSPAEQHAHIAWDPGALGLARGLAARLNAPLVCAGISRLVYDLNRAPDAAGAIAARSETFDIPGNQGLDPEARQRRTSAVYLPFHAALHGEIARRMAALERPIMVTVHSFTPVYFGQRRGVELGIIHDADTTLAKAVLNAALAQTPLNAQLNAPYSAADDVTHTLRLHATPYGLLNVMLEIRNDLLADANAEQAMADTLAPVLLAAIAAVGDSAMTKAAV